MGYAGGGGGGASNLPDLGDVADTVSPTKGSILVPDGTSWTEVAVGSDDQVLTADAAQTAGVKWAAAAAGSASYAETIGDGSTTSFTITHNLGVTDVHVAVIDLSTSPDEFVLADRYVVDTNTVRVDFASAPATDQYRVVVLSAGGTGGGGGSAGRTLLDTVTLAADATHIEFSGISGSHRTLLVEGRLRGDAGNHADEVAFRVGNGTVDSGSNYAYNFRGSHTGTAGAANRFIVGSVSMPGPSADAGIFAPVRVWMYRYADASQFRQFEGRAGGWFSSTGSGPSTRMFGNWRNAADVIDVVRFVPTGSSTNYVAGSELSLYGLA